MQSTLKAAIRKSSLARRIWRGGLRDTVIDRQFDRLEREWRAVCRDTPPAALRAAGDTLLILPPDPIFLTASKGDEAMIGSTINAARADPSIGRIAIVTGSPVAQARGQALGIETCPITFGGSLRSNVEAMMALGVKASVTIGADVMDGAYDGSFSFELFALTDLLRRRGVEARMTGFSVSKSPYRKLGQAYDGAAEGLVFKARDPDSFERLKALTTASSELVADPAFLLPASVSETSRKYVDWIEERQSLGRRVIGINIHPLLFDRGQQDDVESLMPIVAQEIDRAARQADFDIALVAHDFRGSSSDSRCLDPLAAALTLEKARVMSVAEELTAGDLKGIAARLDGVFSGRMHLAIAALGSGTPICGVSYKDKFSGLLKHFALDQHLLIDSRDVLKPGAISTALTAFVRDIPSLKEQVERALPQVKAMSKKNYST